MSWSKNTQQWEPLEVPKPQESIVFPIDKKSRERVWTLGWERARREVRVQDLVAKLVDRAWQVYRKYRPHQEGAVPGTWWEDARYSATESGTKILKDLFGERELFSYPKSVYLVEDCLRASNCSSQSWALDFLAGSGTTAHAIINLNQDGGKRKYILVEMADYFDTVLLPRIKKVAFCLKWKDGKPTNHRGTSHTIKYHHLEQYEDTLHNLEIPDLKRGQLALERFGDEYLLRYMLSLETRGSPSLLNLDQFKNPFAYELKIEEGEELKSRTIDFVETFNYLLGLHVKKMRQIRKGKRIYRAVLGEKNGKRILVIWRPVAEIESSTEALIEDRDFIREKLLPTVDGSKFDRIFVNSPCILESAEAIEPEFKRLMLLEE